MITQGGTKHRRHGMQTRSASLNKTTGRTRAQTWWLPSINNHVLGNRWGYPPLMDQPGTTGAAHPSYGHPNSSTSRNSGGTLGQRTYQQYTTVFFKNKNPNHSQKSPWRFNIMHPQQTRSLIINCKHYQPTPFTTIVIASLKIISSWINTHDCHHHQSTSRKSIDHY